MVTSAQWWGGLGEQGAGNQGLGREKGTAPGAGWSPEKASVATVLSMDSSVVMPSLLGKSCLLAAVEAEVPQGLARDQGLAGLGCSGVRTCSRHMGDSGLGGYGELAHAEPTRMLVGEDKTGSYQRGQNGHGDGGEPGLWERSHHLSKGR